MTVEEYFWMKNTADEDGIPAAVSYEYTPDDGPGDTGSSIYFDGIDRQVRDLLHALKQKCAGLTALKRTAGYYTERQNAALELIMIRNSLNLIIGGNNEPKTIERRKRAEIVRTTFLVGQSRRGSAGPASSGAVPGTGEQSAERPTGNHPGAKGPDKSLTLGRTQ